MGWALPGSSGSPKLTDVRVSDPPAAASFVMGFSGKLASLAASDLAALCAEELAKPNGFERDSRLLMICARWAETDPAAGLEWIRKNPSELSPFLRSRLLTEWAMLNSDAAWAAIPPGPEGDNDRYQVTSALLHEDRDLFMSWFRRVGKPTPANDPAWRMIAERHAGELEAIALKQLKEQPEDAAVLFSLLSAVRAEKDPEAAWQWALTLDSTVRAEAITSALFVLAKASPTDAWKRFAQLDKESFGEIDRSGIGSRILSDLAKTDPAAAMKLILETKGNDGVFELGGIEVMDKAVGRALENGAMSPLEAYRLLASAKGSASNLPLNVLRKIWSGLPADKLSDAANAIASEPDDPSRGNALSAITAAWFRKAPEAAMRFMTGVKDADLRKEILGGILQTATVGNISPADQVRNFQQIPAEDLAGVFNQFMNRYGSSVPGTDASILGNPSYNPEDFGPLLAGLPVSDERSMAVRNVASRWGELDPSAALAWAAGLADPDARSKAYTGAIDGWAYHDPFAAAEWLSHQPMGPERDAATQPLVTRVAESDPTGAWEWAASIQDPALQLHSRLMMLPSWEKRDPEAARAAYQKYVSSLPPAEAAKLPNPFSKK